jgi:hypothetical protein
MTSRIQEYWRQVAALAATLPEFVWLASRSGAEASILTQVPAGVAARLLHEGSHRLAAPEEVEAHHAREKALAQQARLEAKRRSGAAVVVVAEPEPAPMTAPSPRRRR